MGIAGLMGIASLNPSYALSMFGGFHPPYAPMQIRRVRRAHQWPVACGAHGTPYALKRPAELVSPGRL